MRLLALDTSTEYLSLALQCDNATLNSPILRFDAMAGQSHSQQILPQIRALLNEANLELADLDGIAFGAGPGSFTGVRIACGVAQGLAFGANLPVVGVNTLMVLAEAASQLTQCDKVIACLDARMGEVYHAAFIRGGDVSGLNSEHLAWLEVSQSGLFKPQALPEVEGDGWVGAGSGWQTYGKPLSQFYGEQVKQVFAEALPHALALLSIAQPLFAAGLAKPASEAAPIYIRNKVALKTAERALALKSNGLKFN